MPRPLLLLLAVWMLGVPHDGKAAVTNRSVSGSQQFTVFCEDRGLRQNLVGAFDEIRGHLFSELGVQMGPPIPIIVNITPRKILEFRRNTWNLRWLEAPDGARVQLDILLDDNIRADGLQEQIVKALLLVLKYQSKPPLGGESYQDPPAWLVEGLSEKIRQRNSPPDPTLYRGLLKAKSMPVLTDWIRIKPERLDSTGRAIYRAYAGALVSFFQSEPAGKAGLRRLLNEIPADPAQAIAWLAARYPSLGAEARELPKWWSLSLAKISASDRYTLRTGRETEEALASLLVVSLQQDGQTVDYTLERFEEFYKAPGLVSALNLLKADLTRLSVQAHPLYRPILAGYDEIISALQKRRVRGLAEKLAGIEALRIEIAERLDEVETYLTWFEGTQVQRSTSEFEGYFELMRKHQAPRQPSREPIGRYLDAIEIEFKR